MDNLLQKAIIAAKINGRRDPDKKAKEMFVRLFGMKNFTNKFEAKFGKYWEAEPVNDKEFDRLKADRSFNSGSIWDLLDVEVPWQYNFLTPAVFSFGILGRVAEWPIFGVRMTSIGRDDYQDVALIIDPEASQDDVINFISRNWKEIQESQDQETKDKLGRIKKRTRHELHNAILKFHSSGMAYQEILIALRKEKLSLSFSNNPIIYIARVINKSKLKRKK